MMKLKLSALTIGAMVALSGCGVSNAVTANGTVVGEPKWESIYNDTFTQSKKSAQRGILINGRDDPKLKLVKLGASKKAVMSPTAWGHDHFNAGFGSRLLTYTFAYPDDTQASGWNHCQAKVSFDKNNTAREIHWNPAGCIMQTVEKIPDDVVAPPPQVQVRKLEISADALFGFDGTTLTQPYISDLDNAANAIKRMQNVSKIVIVGHTDNWGSDEYNQQLSEQRAREVAKYLSMQGAPEHLMYIVGQGENELIKDCGEPKGRATEADKACNKPNRRVTVYIQGQIEEQM